LIDDAVINGSTIGALHAQVLEVLKLRQLPIGLIGAVQIHFK
jgi:hypothetical protein